MEAITKRKSIRSFKPCTISKKVIQEIEAQARTAPSAGDLKAYRLYRIKSKQTIKRLAVAAGQDWINGAAVVFVICAEPGKSGIKYGDRGRNQYCVQDATIFCAYLDLLFVEAGYGTCWVGSINITEVERNVLTQPGSVVLNYLVVGGI